MRAQVRMGPSHPGPSHVLPSGNRMCGGACAMCAVRPGSPVLRVSHVSQNLLYGPFPTAQLLRAGWAQGCPAGEQCGGCVRHRPCLLYTMVSELIEEMNPVKKSQLPYTPGTYRDHRHYDHRQQAATPFSSLAPHPSPRRRRVSGSGEGHPVELMDGYPTGSIILLLLALSTIMRSGRQWCGYP